VTKQLNKLINVLRSWNSSRGTVQRELILVKVRPTRRAVTVLET